MIKYLMKYDLKRMLKILVFLYAITIGLAIITRLIAIGNNIQLLNILANVFKSLTISAMAAVLINMFVHIIMAFTTTFYKDQSYLTHTLPVKKDELLLSKYISSLIVIFCSIFVCVIAFLIMFYSPEFIQGLSDYIQATTTNFNISPIVFIMLIILVILFQICAFMSFGFTSIILGYANNKKRGVKGLIWFLIFYFVSMQVTLLIAIIISAITGNLQDMFSETMSQSVFLMLIIVCIVLYAIYAVLFYFISKKLFEKGVNVD